MGHDDQTRSLPPSAAGMQGESGLVAEIPGYRLVGILGQGGMGSVFEAEQVSPRRPVAIKIIRPQFTGPELLRRFELEKEVLGRLEHAGIARIYEAGVIAAAGGLLQPYFVMELVRGRTLPDHAAAAGLDVRGRMKLLARLCDAVQHAHEKGVIHRDLKPANILVREDGEPKVLDFGVARVTGDGLGELTSRETQTGQVIGTLQYMSPEQASGDIRNVDTRSDVYALGLIAFELLCGQRPYDVSDVPLARAIDIIRDVRPPRLGQLEKECRGDIENIVAKALAKEKEARYGTAGELGDDIRRHLALEPVAARPPSTWYQFSRFARRNRTLVGGLAATLVALLAGVIVATTLAVRLRRSNGQVTAQRNELGNRLARSQVDAAELARQQGAWERAAEHYRLAIEAGADDPYLLRIRRISALTHLLRGQQADEELSAVERELDAPHPPARASALRGLAHFARASLPARYQRGTATDSFRLALEKGLPPPEAAFARAYLATTASECIDDLRECLRNDPFNVEAHAWLGMVLLIVGDLQEGDAHLEIASLLAPRDPVLLAMRGLVIAALRPAAVADALAGELKGLPPSHQQLVRSAASAFQAGSEFIAREDAGTEGIMDRLRVVGRIVSVLQQLSNLAGASTADTQSIVSDLPPFFREAASSLIKAAINDAVGFGDASTPALDHACQVCPAPLLFWVRGVRRLTRHQDFAGAAQDMQRVLAWPEIDLFPSFKLVAGYVIVAHRSRQMMPVGRNIDPAKGREHLEFVRAHLGRFHRILGTDAFVAALIAIRLRDAASAREFMDMLLADHDVVYRGCGVMIEPFVQELEGGRDRALACADALLAEAAAGSAELAAARRFLSKHDDFRQELVELRARVSQGRPGSGPTPGAAAR